MVGGKQIEKIAREKNYREYVVFWFSGFVVFVFVWLFAGKCMLAHPLQIIWCIVLGVCMGSSEKNRVYISTRETRNKTGKLKKT